MSHLISIVSHKQGDLVYPLLKDLQYFCSDIDLDVILTLNLPEKILFNKTDFGFRLEIHENDRPKGFGANHNSAFQSKFSNFFGVLNPDLRLSQDPFLPLSAALADKEVGLIAPQIIDKDGFTEDSARKLPTPARLLRRYVGRKGGSKLDYQMNQRFTPDWVAGIFMFFPSAVFAEMGGFDERYFLYFEDVDLCSRLRLKGYKITLEPSVSVIHEARRDSHQRFHYLMWHVISGLRFFSSRVFWASIWNHLNKTTQNTL